MSKDVSIEYAHIYSNSSIQAEHHIAIEILSKLKDQLESKHQSFSLVVLIDDYSFPDPSFDYDAFGNWLKTQGYEPELMLRESQLIPLCDEVIYLIEDDKLKDKITKYVQAKKYPCSLFIATWYLLRLGHLSSNQFPTDLRAPKLVNILPDSFKPFEEQGLQIIASTKFKESLDQISYQYIDGRLLV